MENVKHDSKEAHKIAAYHEVQNELKRQIETIKSQINIKRGVSAGFKAAVENVISQQKNFQKHVDESEMDLGIARVAINELDKCVQILSKYGHQQELEAANLQGQVKSLEDQVKSTELLISKQQTKSTKGDRRTAIREAGRQRRQAKTQKPNNGNNQQKVVPIQRKTRGRKKLATKKM